MASWRRMWPLVVLVVGLSAEARQVRMARGRVAAVAAKQTAKSTLVLDTLGRRNPRSRTYFAEDSYLRVPRRGRRRLFLRKAPTVRTARRIYAGYFRNLRSSRSRRSGNKQIFDLRPSSRGILISCSQMRSQTGEPKDSDRSAEGYPRGRPLGRVEEMVLRRHGKLANGFEGAVRQRREACSGSHPYAGRVSKARITVYWKTKLKLAGRSFKVVNTPSRVSFSLKMSVNNRAMRGLKKKFEGPVRKKVKSEVSKALKTIYSSKLIQAAMVTDISRIIKQIDNKGAAYEDGENEADDGPIPVVEDVYEDRDDFVFTLGNETLPKSEPIEPTTQPCADSVFNGDCDIEDPPTIGPAPSGQPTVAEPLHGGTGPTLPPDLPCEGDDNCITASDQPPPTVTELVSFTLLPEVPPTECATVQPTPIVPLPGYEG